MADIEIGTIRKLYCNTCKTVTSHEVKGLHSRREVQSAENQIIFSEEWEYRFWACRGCDTALLEEAYTNDGMINGTGNVFDSTYYPRRARELWPQRRYRHLDPKLRSIYKEVITTFNAGAMIACALCLRALLEGICVSKGITDEVAWGLEKKLMKLGEGNHVPSNIVEYLSSFKFIGDDAAHRLEARSPEELTSAIGVMEDLLNFLYDVEYELLTKAKKLAELRSKRSGAISAE